MVPKLQTLALLNGIYLAEQKQAIHVERRVIQENFFYQKYLVYDHSDRKHTQEFLRSSSSEMLLKGCVNDVWQPCQ